jgi:hypothetical protein
VFKRQVRGLAAPLATGWDGYHAYELSVATHLSSLRRQPVALPLAAPEADAELAAALKPQ